MFTNTTGTPINPSSLRRRLAKVTEAAGLGRWHPHELRHSAAWLPSASGVPLEEVADVLGHHATRMTALVYRHATTPTVKASRRPCAKCRRPADGIWGGLAPRARRALRTDRQAA